MFYYKINNLISNTGIADYKGLSIDSIIGGTQVYDLETENICLVGSSENILSNGELIQITETDYTSEKQNIISNYPVRGKTEVELLQDQLIAANDYAKSVNDNLIAFQDYIFANDASLPQ